MRFQKRLQAAIHGMPEAAHTLDYKLLKKALRDVDGDTTAFTAHLEAQLQKVDEYYVAAEAALEQTMAAATARAAAGPPPRALLTQVRRDAASLQRFAALNYVAVVKATKKAAKKGAAAPTALAALAPRAFFASPRLASLLTAVDVALAEDDLAACDLGTVDTRGGRRSASPPPPAAGELGCPVCIGRLRQPVVLTCGHRFCWGCATGAAGAAVARGAAAAKKGGSDEGAVALEATTFWPCPTCRKPQAWDDGPVLEVDANLERLLATLGPASEPGSPPSEAEPATPPAPGLLPPKQPGAPNLTVVLDLDGTLISSYPPSRAGALLGGRDGGTAYIVGVGSALNPDGVLVVERPGLGPFLRGLARVAEVAVYTAGLQDYAEPIIDELEKRYGVPSRSMRLYRPATESTPAYPCVKNLGALGRPLARTLLVDDTPLAFLAHPSNGVPVVPWRGDGGGADTVLTGALLPLLTELAAIDGDIRPTLDARFQMKAWFSSQALPCGEDVLSKPVVEPAAAVDVAASTAPDTESDEDVTAPPLRPLAVFDFDHTLLDADIGLEIVTTLTPELAPQIQTLAMPQSFVAATNAVLREAARRGVSRDAVLATARRVGLGLHGGGAAALRAAAAAADVAILSDANHVFITSALAAAGLADAVGTVVTNGASFKPTPPGAGGAAHHLVIEPRHAPGRHACPRCPANLCKGLELGLLRRSKTRQRVIYSGDGANDLCPALALTRGDAVLVRRGHGLERLLRERGAAAPPRADTPPRSPVLAAAADSSLAAALAPGVAAYAWTTRDELAALVAALLES